MCLSRSVVPMMGEHMVEFMIFVVGTIAKCIILIHPCQFWIMIQRPQFRYVFLAWYFSHYDSMYFVCLLEISGHCMYIVCKSLLDSPWVIFMVIEHNILALYNSMYLFAYQKFLLALAFHVFICYTNFFDTVISCICCSWGTFGTLAP